MVHLSDLKIPRSKNEFKYLTYEFDSLNYIREFIDLESYESFMCI